ncbi:MAG: hypothetical protein KC492_13250 [Myxococcales bacterium]|nr:hypothetical protein [Myxococcales bacterium]
MKKANMIRFKAVDNAATELTSLLIAAGQQVRATEPGTIRWYGLSRENADDEVAIFDVFPNQAGRQAHFDGQVAAALADKAPGLVRGGWEDGVLANVSNMVALAEHEADNDVEIRKASYITLTAAPGKAAELEAFLAAGRDVVAETEPKTKYWVALKSEDNLGQFAIFDVFESDEGRAEHFRGQVAEALADKADELVARGWEMGVLANVVHFDVRTNMRRPT